MTEAFVYTETDRTKSRWVARAYQDFVKSTGRSRTTLRGLFYHALQMKASDYPICGGFVGEIRIMRPYHENDGEKLPKWMSKARSLGFIPADAILEETAGEQLFPPEIDWERPYFLEVWVAKSALNPLLYPICQKYGVTLVSVNGRASEDAISALHQRCRQPTIILCLSDLSPSGAFFSSDLASEIAKVEPSMGNRDIKLKCIGLKPEQVLDLKLPLVNAKMNSKEDHNRFKRYLKPYPIDPRKMAELDCLEVHYPGGIAGFLSEALAKYLSGSDPDNESWIIQKSK
ncbi:MAG: hypothetical protein NTU95_00295 [Methanothrix sp.]|nr:hypothetical protein [Methanothrix sp.]